MQSMFVIYHNMDSCKFEKLPNFPMKYTELTLTNVPVFQHAELSTLPIEHFRIQQA